MRLMNEVFLNGKFAVQARVLENDADSASYFMGVFNDVYSQNFGTAGRRREQGGQYFKESGFAGTVRAQKPENPAFFNGQVYPAQYFNGAGFSFAGIGVAYSGYPNSGHANTLS
jgi:hypothetical protein